MGVKEDKEEEKRDAKKVYTIRLFVSFLLMFIYILIGFIEAFFNTVKFDEKFTDNMFYAFIIVTAFNYRKEVGMLLSTIGLKFPKINEPEKEKSSE